MLSNITMVTEKVYCISMPMRNYQRRCIPCELIDHHA